jgi:hypothetical protein
MGQGVGRGVLEWGISTQHQYNGIAAKGAECRESPTATNSVQFAHTCP